MYACVYYVCIHVLYIIICMGRVNAGAAKAMEVQTCSFTRVTR